MSLQCGARPFLNDAPDRKSRKILEGVIFAPLEEFVAL
jgi:hypothetical protein